MMSNLSDSTSIYASGVIQLFDFDSGDLILEKKNAINYGKLLGILTESLLSGNALTIDSVCFGDEGVIVNSIGGITYKPTNTHSGTSQELHNEILVKPLTVSTDIAIDHRITPIYSMTNGAVQIVVNSMIDYSEEISQSTEYVMNELGLKMSDDTLLTHVTFHPIQKTSGRKIQLIYTISLQIGS